MPRSANSPATDLTAAQARIKRKLRALDQAIKQGPDPVAELARLERDLDELIKTAKETASVTFIRSRQVEIRMRLEAITSEHQLGRPGGQR
jgi:hypothetical protein